MRWRVLVAAWLLLCASPCGGRVARAAGDAPRPTLVIADFEAGGFEPWRTAGAAFGPAPAAGTLLQQQPVSGFAGQRLANSYHGGDNAQGELLSPEFVVQRKYLNFLVGGGNLPGQVGVELLPAAGGAAWFTAQGTANTGADDEHLSWRTWDVQHLAGQSARFRVFDRAEGGWGHIQVDQFEQSDEPRVAPAVSPAIQLAMASVAGAAPRAAEDVERPGYHFRPPALWNNDPNGPLFHQGVYHLFYQHNPFGDRWEHMHWGHARSRDLVYWEHLPVALAPSLELGEQHCFSGCAARDSQGRVRLLYTSIGARAPEQWLAEPLDDELLAWKKPDAKGLLTTKLHGQQVIDDWRDPYYFEAGSRRFLVCGGHPRGRHGSIMLYEAQDGALQQWVYRGVAFEGEEGNWECPNLFPLDGRWVLIYSPHGVVKYYVGDFDVENYRFVPTRHGTLDASDHYYAPNGLSDGRRHVLWGWVRGFPQGRGWNGCLTLPRVLSLDAAGDLVQQPASELTALREELLLEMDDVPLVDMKLPLSVAGHSLEIEMVLDVAAGASGGIELRRSADGQRAVRLVRDERQRTPEQPADEHLLVLDGAQGLVRRSFGAPFRLRIFLDRSLVEVYPELGPTISRVVQADPADVGLALFGQGLVAVHDLRIWRLKSIW